jgi:hypothetical protein
VVVTGLADPTKNTIELPGALLTLFEKRNRGSLFGSGDPFHDIPRMVELYQVRRPEAGRADHHDLHARPDQRGVPGPAGRQERPRA